MTAEHLLALPDDGYRHELQAGLLIAEPLPMLPHARVQGRLIRLLGAHVERQALGEILGEMGYLLAHDPDTVRGPDVSFLSQVRASALSDGTCFVEGAPDLAVEILSPSNRSAEMHAKVADYLAAGASLVWLVDPQTRTVTVYRSLLSPRVLDADATLEAEDVLPGFSVPLDAIFGD
jgi:Uma2 family endonuclease